MRKTVLSLTLLSLSALLIGTGCNRKAQATPRPAPEVKAVKVQELPYRPSTLVIAEIKAFDEVNLVARVEGYLRKRHFKEGARVKKDQLLFEIEPEVYQAKVKAAEAKLTKAQAAQKNADTDYNRQRKLLTTKAVSEQNYDKAEAAKLEADAEVKNAEAELQLAKQNLSYTKIYAPFDGNVGLSAYSEGNLVNISSGTLATVVRNNPVRVEFVISELQLLFLLRERIESEDPLEFKLITQDGGEYPREGKISFWDNKVNTSTGTFRIQAEFDNPEGFLTAGMFCRIRIRVKKSLKGILVPEEALMMDQAGEYVYVIGADGTVSRKNVKVSYREKGFAAVSSGVKAGDVVIDEGTQQVKPGAKARAKLHGWKPGSNAAPAAKPVAKFVGRSDKKAAKPADKPAAKPANQPAATAEKKVK
ncbi:MAG: efflux RND transporter periplasmic adaptor subunit [Lentisphaeria bacterium]|nr:efflux RND transporter periplasmic adaptor subunit [Lentisphaeria bacterium]